MWCIQGGKNSFEWPSDRIVISPCINLTIYPCKKEYKRVYHMLHFHIPFKGLSFNGFFYSERYYPKQRPMRINRCWLDLIQSRVKRIIKTSVTCDHYKLQSSRKSLRTGSAEFSIMLPTNTYTLSISAYETCKTRHTRIIFLWKKENIIFL